LHKKKIIGLSKADLIDKELQEMLKSELPKEIKSVFFSAITQQGVQELKDELWKLMQETY
jgi:GTP-binding protein